MNAAETLGVLHEIVTKRLTMTLKRLNSKRAVATTDVGEDEKGPFVWFGIDGKRSKLRLDLESTQVWNKSKGGGGWFDA